MTKSFLLVEEKLYLPLYLQELAHISFKEKCVGIWVRTMGVCKSLRTRVNLVDLLYI